MKPAKSFSWMSSIVKVAAKSAINPSPAERAVAFLKRLYEDLDGYILVAAVDPDDGAISGHAVATSNIAKLTGFIEQCNGKKNLYFSVNTLRIPVTPKAAKEDVLALVFLHVDIDPRDDEPFESGRTRILAFIKAFPVLPTIIIDSGGGYQCFWRLKVPIPVADNINQLETYNQRLKQYFGADHCWNIDRLMRLPFTWNLPNEIKRAKGRKKAPASVVAISDDAYDLSDFDFLPKVTVSAAGPSPSIEPEDIPDRFWELLKTDPKLKARWEGNSKGLKDTSRSGLDMSLAGMLWDREFTKDEIAGVLCAFEHGKANEGGPAYLATTLSKLSQHVPTQDIEHRTDLGNARRLVNLHGHRIRYVHKFKQWLIWDERRWVPDDDEAIMRLAKDTVRTIYAEAAQQHDSAARAALAKWATQSESAERLTKMVQLAKSEPGIPISPDDLDRDPMLLGVLNGTVDLFTGGLREPCPADYITKQAPVAYDKNAKCPMFLAFLDQIMAGNTELVGFLQRAAGYSLSRCRSNQSCDCVLKAQPRRARLAAVPPVEEAERGKAKAMGTHCQLAW